MKATMVNVIKMEHVHVKLTGKDLHVTHIVLIHVLDMECAL